MIQGLVSIDNTQAAFLHESSSYSFKDKKAFVQEALILLEKTLEYDTLEDVLKRGPLNPETAVQVCLSILDGLAILHRHNIIHRDLKPSNIMLKGDKPILLDFGLAKLPFNNTVTPSDYLAPESFSGRFSPAADIWAIGVILYQMLANRLPFERADEFSLLQAIMNDPPLPLPDFVPEPLRFVIGKALAKQPEARFQSAAQMRDALRAAWQPESMITKAPGEKSEAEWEAEVNSYFLEMEKLNESTRQKREEIDRLKAETREIAEESRTLLVQLERDIGCGKNY